MLKIREKQAERLPLEAGLGWVVKLDRGDFIARSALQQQKDDGVARRLAGFRLTERGFPRAGYDIASEGQVVGTVTSGTLSPCLAHGIGLGYIPPAIGRAGTPLEIIIRGQPVPAEVVRPPFYADGSLKR